MPGNYYLFDKEATSEPNSRVNDAEISKISKSLMEDKEVKIDIQNC